MFDFSTKQLVITGANRGIGLAVAKSFIAVGANVTLVALEQDVIDVAAQLSRDYKRSVKGFVCDISCVESIDLLANSIVHIDILINNAGFEQATPIANLSPEVSKTFRNIIETNVIGTFEVTRALLPKIPAGGRIINTASVWSKTAVAEFSAYCASKHAILGLTRSLSKELGARNIAVNAVCPGWVKTEASMRSLHSMAESNHQGIDNAIGDIIASQSFSGLMVPDDMTDIYLFLASNAARNITGQAYTVDRGEIMQ